MAMKYKLDELEMDDWYLLLELIISSCEMSGGEICHKINDADLIKLVKSKPVSEINCNQIDFMMKKLGEERVIGWNVFGDDDMSYPDFEFTYNRSTFEFIRKQIIQRLRDDRQSLLERVNNLEKELKSVYGFSPSLINKKINDTNENIEKLLATIKENKMLSSLEEPVLEFAEYTKKIKGINKSYQNIYEIVLKPIQKEGEKGIKATVRWAIISIVVATLISTAISNWNSIKTISHGLTM